MMRVLNLVILTGIVNLSIVFADPSDWSVNPSEYEHTASMTGILLFDDVQSDDPNDIVAAFVGDECRGVDDLGLYFSPTGNWVWGITLYSNGGDETFTFKGYDASEGSEYDITDFSYTFVPDDIVGSAVVPVEWEFTTMDLPDWSVNPSDFEYTASMTGILIFEGSQSDDSDDMVAAFVGDECRGVDNQGIFFPPTGNWVWGITLYANDEGETFTFRGYDASEGLEYDITNFSYTFVSDDIVGSAEDPVEWVFTTADLPDWSVNPSDYEYTSSMTGILLFDGVQSDDPNDIVAAFVGDECRGVDAYGIYFPPSGNWVWGITLYANDEGETFTFRGYDASENSVYDYTSFTYVFVVDDIVGSADDPVEWAFTTEEPPSVPTVTITSPEDGATLSSGDFSVEYSTTDFNIGSSGCDDCDGHVHVFVDGSPNPYGDYMVYEPGPVSLTGVPFGDHSITVQLVDHSHQPFDPSVESTVNITVEEIESPDWSVNPSDYEYTSSMTGILLFDGMQSDDPNDIVAAFVGDECRGVDAYGIYFPPSGNWVWGITLYANDEGETFTFRGYDASENSVYDYTSFTYVFVADDIVGSADDPVEWAFTTTEPPEPPDWSVNPSDYEYTSSMTGILLFDGMQSDDSNDIVAAFVGDECRGVDNYGIYFPPSGNWVWGITLYANDEGETFTFRGFDASENSVYDYTSYTYVFVADDIVGDATNPVEWNFTSSPPVEDLWPPSNLSADALQNESGVDVHLEWDAPQEPNNITINWDSGENFDGIGLTDGGDWMYAARWDAPDITDYDGYFLNTVNFFPRGMNTSYTLRVWYGYNAGVLLYEQAVNDPVIEQWNEITLDYPVQIDASDELWIGFALSNPAGEFPAGCDAGPAVLFHGDMLTLDGEVWESMATSYGLNYNWNIQGVLYAENMTGTIGNDPIVLGNTTTSTEYSSTKEIPLLNGHLGQPENALLVDLHTRDFQHYNVYRDGMEIGTALDEEYDDLQVPDGVYEYYVTAQYDGGESEPSNSVTVTVDFVSNFEIVEMYILLDDYPGETTWDLRDDSGSILYSGGPYNQPGGEVNESWSLSLGDYMWTIYDAYNDGICCEYGEGMYELSMLGEVFASGGDFDSYDMVPFNVPGGVTNHAPVLAEIDNQITDEDTPLVITLSASDVDGDTLIYSAVSGDTSEVIVSILDNQLTLTPVLDWYGMVGITVTVSDGQLEDSQVFALNVIPVNDAPVLAEIGNQETNEDEPLTIMISASDVDTDVPELNFDFSSDTTSIIISVDGDQNSGEYLLTMTPATNWNGTANITVTVSDGELEDLEVFVLTVALVNDAPVADAGTDTTITVFPNIDQAAVTLDGSGSYDIDNEIVSFFWFEEGEIIAPGVTPTVYLGIGIHEITLTVTDESGDSSSDEVVITIEQLESYWIPPTPTDQYHLLMVGDVTVGQDTLVPGIDEIGIFDGDLLVGASFYSGELGQQILAWADDETTEELDGFTEGNTIIFKLYDLSVDAVLEPVSAEYIEFPNWTTDGLFGAGNVSGVNLTFNRAPYFVSDPVTTAQENVSYVYTPVALDDDVADYGDQVTITADELPLWLSFDGTTLSGTPTNIDLGFHDVTLIATDLSGETDTQSFQVEVIFDNVLPDGWSWKGFPVLPAEPMDAETFFGPVLDDVVIVKSREDGSMVNIDGTWVGGDFIINNMDGYIIKMVAGVSFSHPNQVRVNPSDVLQMNTSWNWINYYGLGAPDAELAFGDILDDLIVAESRDGALLDTPWGLINGIGNMVFTDGYLVKLLNGNTLTWPSGSARSVASAMDVSPTQEPNHFVPIKTLSYHLINIHWADPDGINYGDEIAVFSENMCVGSVVYDGNTVQQILAWEAINSQSNDGFHSGESIQFFHWNGAEEEELTSEIDYVDFDGWSSSGIFQSGGMSGVNVTMTTLASSDDTHLPEKIKLIGNFPNPFNPYTTIKYELTHDADVSLMIYNSLGEVVQALVNHNQPSGRHDAVWNGESTMNSVVPSGIYIYQLTVDGVISGTRKMVLVK